MTENIKRLFQNYILAQCRCAGIHNIHLLFPLLFFGMIFVASEAQAKVVQFCRHDDHPVDTVFWHTETSVPSDLIGTPWSEVQSDVGAIFDRLISKTSSLKVVEASEDAQHTLSRHPGSVYLNVVFSYAKKDAFTTPLEQDALVIWVETTRYEPNGEAGATPVTKRSRADLLLLGKPPVNGTHFVKFASPFFYGTRNLLTYVSCDVLGHDTNKICSNASDPVENQIIDRPKTDQQCVEPPPNPLSKGDMDKIRKALQQ